MYSIAGSVVREFFDRGRTGLERRGRGEPDNSLGRHVDPITGPRVAGAAGFAAAQLERPEPGDLDPAALHEHTGDGLEDLADRVRVPDGFGEFGCSHRGYR